MHRALDLLHDAVIQVLVPIIPQLLLPEEIAGCLDIILRKLEHYIAVVHVRRDQRHDAPSVHCTQLLPHQLRQLSQL